MIQATIIADSLNENGQRLTTMMVTFPRFILAELNTHRMLSKNSASSRAIPFTKMVEAVQDNPFVPIAWQKEHKGMQGTEYFTDLEDIKRLEEHWLISRDMAIMCAKNQSILGTTKQLCNRLLEPFMWHTVLITATEWQNFFNLRCPDYVFHNENEEYHFKSRKDAIKHFGENEPVEYETGDIPLKDLTDLQWLQLNRGQSEIHMMALAEAIYDALQQSTPKQLKNGEWHIPFEDKITDVDHVFRIMKGPMNRLEAKIQISTAMCAHISYTLVGQSTKKSDYSKDIDLHDRLLSSCHFSPFEHCAQAQGDSMMYANFKGFKQYRQLIEK